MARRSLAFALAFALLLALGTSGCRALDTPPRPEAHCRHECRERAPRCSEHECERGCGYILDRLAEHEDAPVVACVASRTGGAPEASPSPVCGDPVWADCAVLVGVHADGGPPAPARPAE
jgi:hypothetical protein